MAAAAIGSKPPNATARWHEFAKDAVGNALAAIEKAKELGVFLRPPRFSNFSELRSLRTELLHQLQLGVDRRKAKGLHLEAAAFESHLRYVKRLISRPFTEGEFENEVRKAEENAVKQWTDQSLVNPSDKVSCGNQEWLLDEQLEPDLVYDSVAAVLPRVEASVESAWRAAVKHVRSGHGINAGCVEGPFVSCTEPVYKFFQLNTLIKTSLKLMFIVIIVGVLLKYIMAQIGRRLLIGTHALTNSSSHQVILNTNQLGGC